MAVTGNRVTPPKFCTNREAFPGQQSAVEKSAQSQRGEGRQVADMSGHMQDRNNYERLPVLRESVRAGIVITAFGDDEEPGGENGQLA